MEEELTSRQLRKRIRSRVRESLDHTKRTLLVTTIKGGKERRAIHARCWEFTQNEPARFKIENLVHRHLRYYMFQEMSDRVHGMLRFEEPLTYGGVHELIGGGDYCLISVAKNWDGIYLKSVASQMPTVEQGQFKKRQIVEKTLKKNKKKKLTKKVSVDDSESRLNEMNALLSAYGYQ